MSKQYTTRDAWEAFRDRQYELACHIWIKLMTDAMSLDNQRSYQLSYTHVLVAQSRFDEAKAILQELFESDPKPIYLHQLAYVSREAGQLDEARRYLEKEKKLITHFERLMRAANEYELGIIAWLEDDLEGAIGHAQSSLAFAQKETDLAAEGCVHRLLADLLKLKGDERGAANNYHAAHQAFLMAGDTLSAKDVDRHLKSMRPS